jgi:putative ABC transport system permease protein
MLRNYLVTALRNLERHRFYAAVSILGLAVAFAAAILIGQFVRNEFSYDHWLPGYRHVYKLTSEQRAPGAPPVSSDGTESPLAGQIKAALPGSTPARLTEDFLPLRRKPGDRSVIEPTFAWADPDFFTVFPLPVLGGDLSKALARPDTVVITRRIARKYFGKDLPLGETLQVQRATRFLPGGFLAAEPPWHTLRVTAVLKDLPANTNLSTEIFASGRSAYSTLTLEDAQPSTRYTRPFVYTFVRLSPNQTEADVQRVLPMVVKPELEARDRLTPGTTYAYHAVPLSEAHLTPVDRTVVIPSRTGSRMVAYGIAGVGALIVLVAAINFVTLMTARASRRAVEVGVRKATGARRVDLMAQFIGEALIQVGLSVLIAAALAEALARPVGAFAQRELAVDFVHDPMLLLGVVLAALILGLLAAIYPAVVLSSFRPASALKGGLVQSSGSPIARQALVVIQFAVLVGLIVTTATLYRQTRYALDRGLGAVDAKLVVGVLTRCNNAFPDEVRKLPGVAGAACAPWRGGCSPGTTARTGSWPIRRPRACRRW